MTPPVRSIPHVHGWTFLAVAVLWLALANTPPNGGDLRALRATIAAQSAQIEELSVDVTTLQTMLENQSGRIDAVDCTLYKLVCHGRATRSTGRDPLIGGKPTATPQPSGPDFAALAQCESSGNPRAVSPSGRYEGLYQFDLATWRSVGGTGHPKDATPAEQTKRARLLYGDRGRAPWPSCGRRL